MWMRRVPRQVRAFVTHWVVDSVAVPDRQPGLRRVLVEWLLPMPVVALRRVLAQDRFLPSPLPNFPRSAPLRPPPWPARWSHLLNWGVADLWDRSAPVQGCRRPIRLVTHTRYSRGLLWLARLVPPRWLPLPSPLLPPLPLPPQLRLPQLPSLLPLRPSRQFASPHSLAPTLSGLPPFQILPGFPFGSPSRNRTSPICLPTSWNRPLRPFPELILLCRITSAISNSPSSAHAISATGVTTESARR